ncbi:MAG: NADH-quinone oxidoreductase subunit L [Ardenticatenia bacterium]|nr:NADH-quinone oxidoreductase subunit L [Ardenticatenia bacterium]
METLLSLTPLVPLFPLLAFLAIVLVLNPNKRLSAAVAIGAVGLSWLLGWAIFFSSIGAGLAEQPYVVELPWMPTGRRLFVMSVMLDPLGAVMLFMVPFVALLIFIYSVGYHNLGQPNEEPRFSRFFAYISLFAAGMLALVVSGNMLLFFIAWEIMGLCSYLLIGFWFYKPSAANAAKKAFLTTRVGDVLLFVGLVLLYSFTGSLNLYEVLSAEHIEFMKESSISVAGLFNLPALPTIALLIFGGAVGKSAQFPLHVWLPDAMEGPTPVSAMIHAATMVAAGVFLVARMLPLFEPIEGSWWLGVVALIGAFTAVFAASIAVAQNDIKRVLAYSTISQLGYMIAALGIGGFIAGVFHMLTHAFFKALLFLGSGSVIHGMEHGVHHVEEHGHGHDGHVDPQDMWNMGNLRQHMPTTFWTYVVGAFALAGVPLITAGFWSKDEILAEAFEKWTHKGVVSIPFVVWLLLTVGAALTAFYMGRQLGLVFGGRERTEAARHAHESPRTMTVPLMILALFAIGFGWVNIPKNVPLVGNGWLFGFLAENHIGALHEPYEKVPFVFSVAALSSVLALGGLALGWWCYRGVTGDATVSPFERDPVARAFARIPLVGRQLWLLLENKYYVDEIYSVVVIRPVLALSAFLNNFDDRWIIDPLVDGVGKAARGLSAVGRWIDTYIVDGIVNYIGYLLDELASGLRLIQTGRLPNYLAILVAGVLALVGLMLR